MEKAVYIMWAFTFLFSIGTIVNLLRFIKRYHFRNESWLDMIFWDKWCDKWL